MSALAVTPGLIPPLRQERTLFFWCLLASIALHALVLLGMSRQEAPAPPSKTLLVLTARLAPIASAPQTARQAPPPERALTKPPEPAPAPRPALAKPPASASPVLPQTAPAEPAKAVVPETASAAPGAADSPPQPAAPGAADAPPQPAAPAPARTVPQAPAGAPGASARYGSEADTGTLEQYRLALIAATRRYKRYPAIAMEKGWQGKVEVHMVIGASGMLASAAIKTSSGHEVLDNQALDMLKKGKTTIPIPAGLRGREFSFDVPVIFNLDNPNS